VTVGLSADRQAAAPPPLDWQIQRIFPVKSSSLKPVILSTHEEEDMKILTAPRSSFVLRVVGNLVRNYTGVHQQHAKRKAVFAGLVLVSLLVLSLPTALAQKDALLLYLPLDGDAKDMSGNEHHGKVEGNAKWVDGKFDKALSFNGSDTFVQIPLEKDITFTEDSSFTAAIWLNTNVPPTPAQDGILGNYRVSTTPFWGLIIRDNGTLIYYLRNGGECTSVSKNPVNDGKWHHVAFLRDRKTKKMALYVDGNLEEEKADPTGNINSGQDIFLGEHLSRFFEGILDEVMLFSRALTQKEIQSVMNSGLKAVFTTSKVASTWGIIKMDYR
jgi:hypothetical protein